MAEEFEFRAMRDAAFWGVDLAGARFRDVDLTGARFHGVVLHDVTIDGSVDRLVVNGVDVTDFVNEHDPWYPIRAGLRSPEPASMRREWDALGAAWAETVAAAQQLPEDRLHASVDGEWSFVQTLRHLVFAMDKWFTVPILGEGFAPLGLPNAGSADFGWPGLDPDLDPSFAEVLAVRDQRTGRLRDHLAALTGADLTGEVGVPENGTVPVAECYLVVFEEEFEHLRYARRDLAALHVRR
jgi:uncharacterized protein YjbI with pentapeptide repeats